VTNNDWNVVFGLTALRLGLVQRRDLQLCQQIRLQHSPPLALEQVLLQRGLLSNSAALQVRQALGGQSWPNPGHKAPAPLAPGRSGVAQAPLHGLDSTASASLQSSFAQGSHPGARPAPPPPSFYPTSTTGSLEASGLRPRPSFASAELGESTTPTSGQGLLSSSGMGGAMPQVGDEFGRYRIEELLGRGGMGVVYKATHLDLARVVALKMLIGQASRDEVALRRFYSEARAAARLSHPHLVSIHDVGCIAGQHYFSMDYVAGVDLAKQLKNRMFSEAEALTLTHKLARALAYAHSKDIVHRDLKPANILIDPQGEPLITDFGIAKDIRRDDGETISGELLGTPAYMSPEQANGRSRGIDGRADIFSLGSILYELLYKQRAFRGTTQYAIVNQVLNDKPVPATARRRRISGAAETICYKCLEKKPRDRYGSASELVEDLELALAGRPLRTPLRHSNRKLWSWSPRGSVATVVAALITGLLFAKLHNDVRIDLAALRINAKRLDNQADALRTSLKDRLDQEHKRARFLSAKAAQLAADGNFSDAIAQARKASAVYPEDLTIQLQLARLLVSLGENPAASLSILALIQDPSVSHEARALEVEAHFKIGDLAATRAALERYRAVAGPRSSPSFLTRFEGLLASADLDWALARDKFRALISIDPEDIDGRARYAQALYETGDPEAALEAAVQASRRDQTSSRAWLVQALCLRDRKQVKQSLTAAREAQKHATGELRPDIDDLITKLSLKVGTSDKHKRSHALLSEARQAFEEKRPNEGRKALSEARKVGLSCFSALYDSGAMHFDHLAQYATAERLFSASIALKNRSTLKPDVLGRAYLYRAAARAHLKSPDKITQAFADIRTALGYAIARERVRPVRTQALNTLLRLSQDAVRKNPEQASQLFTLLLSELEWGRALNNDSHDRTRLLAHLGRARARSASGELDKALVDLRAAKALPGANSATISARIEQLEAQRKADK
jgi:serine/threonine protein kinase